MDWKEKKRQKSSTFDYYFFEAYYAFDCFTRQGRRLESRVPQTRKREPSVSHRVNYTQTANVR